MSCFGISGTEMGVWEYGVDRHLVHVLLWLGLGERL
jgi:hypothetical protein